MHLSEFAQTQIDIIHDLRQENNDPTIGASTAQVKCIVIALVSEVGEDYRIPALRSLIEAGGKFTSTKQLSLRDASVLIDWLYGGQTPGPHAQITPEALDTLHEIRSSLQGIAYQKEELDGTWILD